MEEINEIKIPKGVESISVTQHDDKIVIEFMPKKPQFKNGDFVYEDGRIMIVNSYPNMYHANTYPEFSAQVLYNSRYGLDFSEPTFRLATEEEKQLLIDAMEKDGKRWNAEKLIVEDIPKPKFKVGDSVKIKEGISSTTHRHVPPSFMGEMDKYIGKKLIIARVINLGRNGVRYMITNDVHIYDEDWLEPYTEELKKGDLAIFWDSHKEHSQIRLYAHRTIERHRDHEGMLWANAIKFISKEQFEKHIKE